MNNEFEDFNSSIDNIAIEREKTKFKIHQLKITHYYSNYDFLESGTPVSISIELNCKYNYELEKLEWKKSLIHTYVSLDNHKEKATDSNIIEIENPESLITEIEKYDLRDLKNNYFTESDDEKFAYWEIEYNNYFKIVGTYDQEIKEFTILSDLLDFKSIIKNN